MSDEEIVSHWNIQGTFLVEIPLAISALKCNHESMAAKWHWGMSIVFMFSLLVFGPSFKSSADALDSWQLVATSPYGPIYGIAYGNGTFVAVSDKPNYFSITNQGGISVSTDGLNWSYTAYDNSLYSVLFSGGSFVVLGEYVFYDSGLVYASSNGLAWNGPSDVGAPLNGVAYGNGIYVGVGYDYDDFDPPDVGTSFTSTDGLDWTYHATGTTNFLNGVAYGNGRFVAVGYPNVEYATNAFIMWTTNGSNWFVIPNSFAGPLESGITYVNGKFYVTEAVFHVPNPTSYYVYSSTNGSNWTQVLTSYQPAIFIPTSPSNPSNGLYVAVGANGSVQTSPDTTNWTSRITGITNDLYAIAVGPGNLFIGGEGGAIYRSGSTLPSLSGMQLPGSGGFELSLAGGIGPAYRIEGSTDLMHWSSLGTITNIEATPQFLDLSATNYSSRFYRAVWP
jgi:hypothetical protein